MDGSTSFAQDGLLALRRQLLRLAKIEEDLAAAERARVPYWMPYPTAMGAHQEAARLLRAEADTLQAAALDRVA
jgi:hypothetical protein